MPVFLQFKKKSWWPTSIYIYMFYLILLYNVEKLYIHSMNEKIWSNRLVHITYTQRTLYFLWLLICYMTNSTHSNHNFICDTCIMKTFILEFNLSYFILCISCHFLQLITFVTWHSSRCTHQIFILHLFFQIVTAEVHAPPQAGVLNLKSKLLLIFVQMFF